MKTFDLILDAPSSILPNSFFCKIIQLVLMTDALLRVLATSDYKKTAHHLHQGAITFWGTGSSLSMAHSNSSHHNEAMQYIKIY